MADFLESKKREIDARLNELPSAATPSTAHREDGEAAPTAT
jgi:hypothetical protein